MDNMLTIVLVGVLVAAVVVGGIFLLMPKEQWITAAGERIFKIPANAEVKFIDTSRENQVAQLKKSGKLIMAIGEDIGTGLNPTIAQDKARLRAYAKIAEFLNARVETFRKLVEGQLSSVQVSGNKQEIEQASVDAYKAVTEMFAKATVSGAYTYAVWEVKEGSTVKTYVLLVYDPASILQIVETNALVNETVKKLGQQGVDFFKSLNSVLEEASKGTPLE